MAPKNASLKNKIASAGEMTELVPDESPAADSDGKKGADGTTAHQRIRGKTCDEQEEHLMEAEEPSEPL